MIYLRTGLAKFLIGHLTKGVHVHLALTSSFVIQKFYFSFYFLHLRLPSGRAPWDYNSHHPPLLLSVCGRGSLYLYSGVVQPAQFLHPINILQSKTTTTIVVYLYPGVIEVWKTARRIARNSHVAPSTGRREVPTFVLLP